MTDEVKSKNDVSRCSNYDGVMLLLHAKARRLETKYAIWKTKSKKHNARKWSDFLASTYTDNEFPDYKIQFDGKGLFYVDVTTWVDLYAYIRDDRFVEELSGIDGFVQHDMNRVYFDSNVGTKKASVDLEKEDIDQVIVFGDKDRIRGNRSGEDITFHGEE